MNKKRNFFRMLVTVALMLTSAIGIQAQTWTASAPAAGTFYLYNVGNDGFLVGGNNYTTRASLTKKGGIPVTLSAGDTDGAWYISTEPTYSNLFLGSDGYVDKANTSSKYTAWLFTAVEGLENTYTMKSTNSAAAYLVGHNTEEAKTSTTTTMPTNAKGYWKLVTRDALIANLANATEDNPIDATFAVMNAYFGANAKTSLWTGDYTAYNGVDDNKCIEQWNSTFDMYQTITGLPNGVYKMQCQGFYRMGGGNNDAATAATARTNGTEVLNAKYYINTTEGSLKSIFDYSLGSSNNSTYNSSTAYSVNGTNVYVPSNLNRASACFQAGEYLNEPIKAVVADGTVTIGFRKTVTSSNDWAAYDNVTLTYYGIDLSALVASYEEQLAAAEALQTAVMNADVKAALNDAITAARTNVNTNSQDWLEATLSTLGTAITNAQASNALYTGPIINAVNGMKAQSTSDDVKTAVQAKYDNGEYASVADVYAAYQPLEIASITPEVNADFTSALINPSFELGNMDGWNCLKTGDDTGVHHADNATYSYSGTVGNYLFNTWANSVQTLDVGQTAKGLPAGYYTLKAIVATFGDGAPVTMTANGVSGSVAPTAEDVDGEKVNGHELIVENIFVSDGSLSIRVQNTGKGQTLLKCDNFQLIYTAPYVAPTEFTDLAYNINIENSEVARYLAQTTYTEGTATVIGNYETDAALRNDQPTTVSVPIPAQTTDATLSLALNSTYTDAETFTVAAGSVLYEVKNLLPGNTYYYKVEASGSVIANGTITTTGQLRMIKADGIANMRDLGGWTNADGNRIKYGKIFRGSELRGGSGYVATDADLAMLKNQLNIGAEVDLREDKDFANGTMNASAIDGATYTYVNLSRWSEDALNFDNAKFKSAFDLVLAALKADKAAYFHCIFGADRTGCFAMLLEGLLGLPVDQLYKDYELTSFSSAGLRDKTGIDHKLQYIKALQGDNLQQKFYNYWRGAVGVSESDLNDFINIMIDGTSPITTATLADLPAKAVADGDYYIYLPTAGKFLGRGEAYGARGLGDNYGVPLQITTNGVNVSTIKFLDNNLYFGSDCFTDKVASYNTVSWFIEQRGEDLILKSHNGSYMGVTTESNGLIKLRANIASAAEATAFTLKSAAEQKAIVAATQQANILAAATAAGINAADVTAFEAALAADYTAVASSAVINSATEGSTTDWPLTQPSQITDTKDNYGNAYNGGDYGGELYQCHGYVSQTVTVPHAGLYKLTLNALYRQGSKENCYALGQKGYNLSNAYVSVNDQYFAQIPSWYSGCASMSDPDNTDQAVARFNAGQYKVEVYTYIDDSKTATIKVNVPGFTPWAWCLFNNFTLTEYAKKVTIDEAATSAPEACDFAAVTLTRTLQPDIWNTVSLPFALDRDQIAASSLKDATIYAFKESDASNITFESAYTIEAGKPYLVKLPEGTTESIVNPTFTGVTVEAKEGETVGESGNVQFVGQTYNKSLAGVANVCYLSTNGKVKQLAANGAIKGLRAYFIVPDAQQQSSDVKLFFNSIEDGIQAMDNGQWTKDNAAIYNLAGQRLKKAQRGVNIINGKKVLIK